MQIIPTFESIISLWIHAFYNSIDHDDHLSLGFSQGKTPKGVKIIFDGYAENSGDENFVYGDSMSFAVFVHKKSLSDFFPEHATAYGAIIHRPKEEFCVYAWYKKSTKEIEIITENIDISSKSLEQQLISMVFEIWRRDNEILKKSTSEGCELFLQELIVEARSRPLLNNEHADGLQFTSISSADDGEILRVTLPNDEFLARKLSPGSNIFDLTFDAKRRLWKNCKFVDLVNEAGNDVAACRAWVLNSIRDRVEFRRSSRTIYLSPKFNEGDQGMYEFEAALYGLHKAAFALLDSEEISDFWLVFTPSSATYLTNRLLKNPAYGEYIVVRLNYSDIELTKEFLKADSTEFTERFVDRVGMYLAVQLDSNNPEYALPEDDGLESKDLEDQKLIAVVKAASMIADHISIETNLQINCYAPTRENGQTIYVSQVYDHRLKTEMKYGLVEGYFKSDKNFRSQIYSVGYDERRRHPTCSDFYRVMLSVKELELLSELYASDPCIETEEPLDEFNLDVYPISRTDALELHRCGAILVDPRPASEFSREHWKSAINVPYKQANLKKFEFADEDSFNFTNLLKQKDTKYVIIGEVDDDVSFKATVRMRRAGAHSTQWCPKFYDNSLNDALASFLSRKSELLVKLQSGFLVLDSSHIYDNQIIKDKEVLAAAFGPFNGNFNSPFPYNSVEDDIVSRLSNYSVDLLKMNANQIIGPLGSGEVKLRCVTEVIGRAGGNGLSKGFRQVTKFFYIDFNCETIAITTRYEINADNHPTGRKIFSYRDSAGNQDIYDNLNYHKYLADLD